MATFDINSTASSVFGIAGQGISLGLLAGTARGVMDTMYPQTRRRRAPVRKMRARRRTQSYPPRRTSRYQYPRPRYAWR